jgi:hypothetical protein
MGLAMDLESNMHNTMAPLLRPPIKCGRCDALGGGQQAAVVGEVEVDGGAGRGGERAVGSGAVAQEVVLRPAVQGGARRGGARRRDPPLLWTEARQPGRSPAAVAVAVFAAIPAGGGVAAALLPPMHGRCGRVEATQHVSGGGGGSQFWGLPVRDAAATACKAAVAACLPPPQQRHQPRLAAAHSPVVRICGHHQQYNAGTLGVGCTPGRRWSSQLGMPKGPFHRCRPAHSGRCLGNAVAPSLWCV